MAAFADNGSTPPEGVEPATTSDAGTEDPATGDAATDEAVSPELLDVELEVEHDIDALLGERDHGEC